MKVEKCKEMYSSPSALSLNPMNIIKRTRCSKHEGYCRR